MMTSWLDASVDFARHAPTGTFALVTSGLGLVAGICCYLGFRQLYRAQVMVDMPTSLLRSAAQGYVELEGYARMMPGEPIYAPLSGMPCVWYRYAVEQTTRDASDDSEGWRVIESGVSEAIFHLADTSGMCIVDPDGAEVTPSVKLCWRGSTARPLYTPKHTGFWDKWLSFGVYRYTECRLHEYDSLYAVGQFIRVGDGEPAGISEATRDVLARWKRDRGWLLREFDANRDGKIDLDEWENVRQAAEREVLNTWEERQDNQQAEMNLLKKPAYGRPYLLSAISQEAMISACRRKAAQGIAGFLLFGLACVWLLGQRFA
jgi:hypothetical protein